MSTHDKFALPLFELAGQKNSSPSLSVPDDGPDFSRYIVYVDESGDHSLHSIDEHYPVFVLAFCVFHKRHYSEHIVPALQKFKFNHFGHDQVVLHENEIRRRKGMFNIFKSGEQQQQFMSELTAIIDYSQFVLISSVIDKRALKALHPEDNAYHIALAFCIECLRLFLSEQGEHKKLTHIVVECRGAKEDKELELEFLRICDRYDREGDSLPMRILFSDKKVMSSGLQLADLVARPVGLKTIRPAQKNRAFEILQTKFYRSKTSEHCGTGSCEGLKIYPSPKSEKPR